MDDLLSSGVGPDPLAGPATSPDSLMVHVAEGARLHVRAWRPTETASARQPVLLVHGLASNARLWDGVAARTSAAGHPTYAVDLRSHGESDAPEEGYDTATAARDLDTLCGALDLGAALVAGQSWGGNVVVRFAARFPQRVAALVLVDGGWIDLRARFDSWEACVAALRPADVDGTPVDRMRGWIRDSHPDWAPWAVDATVANLRVDADGLVHRRLTIPHHLSILRSMWDDPPAPYYARVAAPARLLPAVRDPGSGRPADVAARAMRDATVRSTTGGTDHDLHAQHPELVAAELVGLGERVAVR